MPCLTRPSSFHTSLPWTKSGDFATANKTLTTLKFKEMKMTAVKRNINSLLNEMGMASQPFRRKRQSGGKSARPMQGCNMVQCDVGTTTIVGNISLSMSRTCDEFDTLSKTSENVFCSEESSALAWDAMWNTLNPGDSQYPIFIMKFPVVCFSLLYFSNSFHRNFTDKLQRWRKWLVEVSQHLEVKTRHSKARQLRQRRQMQSSKRDS